MENAFLDLTKDIVIDKFGELYIVQKPESPELLFKGPYLEESEEYIKFTHLLYLAKKLELKWFPQPVGIIRFNKMFHTGDNDLDLRLDTIEREFLVLAYEFDLTWNSELFNSKIDKVPKFISQELQIEDLSKLVSLKYQQRKAFKLIDEMDKIVSLYDPEKVLSDKFQCPDFPRDAKGIKEEKRKILVGLKRKVYENFDSVLSHDLIFELAILFLFDYDISLDSIYYTNLFDTLEITPDSRDSCNSEDLKFYGYKFGEIESDELSEATLHNFRVRVNTSSNSRLWINVESSVQSKKFLTDVKSGYFSLTPDYNAFINDYSITYYFDILAQLQEILPNLPKYLQNRAKVIIAGLTNVLLTRYSGNYNQYPGAPYPSNVFISKKNISTLGGYSELPELPTFKILRPRVIQIYPNLPFYLQARRTLQEMKNSLVKIPYGYFSIGDSVINLNIQKSEVLTLENCKDIDKQKNITIFKKDYNIFLFGPMKIDSPEFFFFVNLSSLANFFNISSYIKFSRIYEIHDKIGFGYPGFPRFESVKNLLNSGNADFALSLTKSEPFNEFVFDLVKYYVLGVNIDLEKFYFFENKFFGFEFEMSKNSDFLHSSSLENQEDRVLFEYLKLSSNWLQKRLAEFNFEIGIPEVDSIYFERKKYLLSKFRNLNSVNNEKKKKSPRVPKVEYLFSLELGEIFSRDIIYSNGNPLESICRSGKTVERTLNELENSILSGDINSAMIYAFEVYAFVGINKYDVVLPLYTRLMTIAMRTLSPKNLVLQSYICAWVVYWVRNGALVFENFAHDADITVGSVLLDKRINANRLVKMLVLLCDSSKSNFVPKAWRAMMVGTSENIEKAIPANIKKEDYELFRSGAKGILKPEHFKLENMALMACVIYNRLKDKYLSAFVWIKAFLENYAGLESEKERYDLVLFDIFEALRNKFVIAPIREAYIADNRYWFLSAIVCNILYGDLNLEYSPESLETEYSLGEGLSSLLSGECTIPVPIFSPNEDLSICDKLIENIYSRLPIEEQLDIDIAN